MYGEGFLFMDGGPLDGSRTGYFNAIRLTAARSRNGRFEIHLISDPAWDQYLTPVNCLRQRLIEYDETGAGLYYIGRFDGGGESRPTTSSRTRRDEDGHYPESDIHTIGVRGSGETAENLTFAAEGAAQMGDRGASDRLAYGGYATLNVGVPPLRAERRGIYLSGDDRSLDRYEGWNPLYGRWPKWSDLYIIRARRRARRRILGKHRLDLARRRLRGDRPAHPRASVRFLWAPEERSEGWPERLLESDDRKFGEFAYRGTLSIVKLNWTVNEYLAGHLLWEAFRPGDYYT